MNRPDTGPGARPRKRADAVCEENDERDLGTEDKLDATATVGVNGPEDAALDRRYSDIAKPATRFALAEAQEHLSGPRGAAAPSELRVRCHGQLPFSCLRARGSLARMLSSSEGRAGSFTTALMRDRWC